MPNGQRWLIAALVLGLLGSNAWWAYHAMDQAVTADYQRTEAGYTQTSLQAALATMPRLASSLSRAEVLERAQHAIGATDTFEKDGITVMAPLTFAFDSTGKLLTVGTIYSVDD